MAKVTKNECIEQIMENKLEELGCNYPIPHPPYCMCESCLRYGEWLRHEYPEVLEQSQESADAEKG